MAVLGAVCGRGEGWFSSFTKGNLPQTGVCSAVLPSPGNAGSCGARRSPRGGWGELAAGSLTVEPCRSSCRLSTPSCFFPFRFSGEPTRTVSALFCRRLPLAAWLRAKRQPFPAERLAARAKDEGRQLSAWKKNAFLLCLLEETPARGWEGAPQPHHPCVTGGRASRCWVLLGGASSGREGRAGCAARLAGLHQAFSPPLAGLFGSLPPVWVTCWSPWCLRVGLCYI